MNKLFQKSKTALLVLPGIILLPGCSVNVALPAAVKDWNYNSSPIKLEDVDIDKYLNLDNVQQVDLRNLNERSHGYIFGFEFIPYWEFLWEDSRIGMGRGENGTLSENHLMSSPDKTNEYEKLIINKNFLVDQYFDKKADGILLMCYSASSCGRSATIKRILDEHFGYTNVYNIGGIMEYKGKYKRTV